MSDIVERLRMPRMYVRYQHVFETAMDGSGVTVAALDEQRALADMRTAANEIERLREALAKTEDVGRLGDDFGLTYGCSKD